jgi:hypothetical protein
VLLGVEPFEGVVLPHPPVRREAVSAATRLANSDHLLFRAVLQQTKVSELLDQPLSLGSHHQVGRHLATALVQSSPRASREDGERITHGTALSVILMDMARAAASSECHGLQSANPRHSFPWKKTRL